MMPWESIQKTDRCPHRDRGDLEYACGLCGLCGSWPRAGETLDQWEARRRQEVDERLAREVADLRRNYAEAE